MKKTAYLILLILGLLFSVETQVVIVLANPRFPSPWGFPEIAVTAPAISNPQSAVWFNLTITKPPNWTDYYEGYITYVYYLIDGSRERLIAATPNHDVGITKIAVDDPVGAANQQSEVNMSIKLEELTEGNHHLNVAVGGVIMKGEVVVENVGKVYDHTINFIVTGESTPSPEPTATPIPPTASPEPTPTSSPYTALELGQEAIFGVTVTIVAICAGLGLLVYLVKRK